MNVRKVEQLARGALEPLLDTAQPGGQDAWRWARAATGVHMALDAIVRECRRGRRFARIARGRLRDRIAVRKGRIRWRFGWEPKATGRRS